MSTQAAGARAVARDRAPIASLKTVDQHIVEIVSDSGEGAQTAGQLFGTVCAKMGNGVWTVEIIPAEIEPPARSQAGASGNRIRLGSGPITNMGDEADVVVSFNEQVLYSRIDVGALGRGTWLFLENKWGLESSPPDVREQYATALADFKERGYRIFEVPMEEECRKVVQNTRRGKNTWVVGLLCALYDRDMDLVREELIKKFTRKGEAVIEFNLALVDAGYQWGLDNLPVRLHVPPREDLGPQIVMNGNQAVGMGIMGAGMELCAMYPITPATSASHYLASAFHEVGGFIHQAEDEISAIGFAIGASYAGKTAVTITSGPGLALKTEFLGLAVMAEIPLVIVVVQRGGPSTGLPTRVEQGDLLAAVFGQPGDAPKIVLAASTIEECFHFMITARKLSEAFRTPVIVLTDANLATGVSPFDRPQPSEEWLAPPIDQSPWRSEVPPYAWDPKTGLSQRPIPGQRHGNYVLTGLTHDERSKVAYESAINQKSMIARSHKLAALQKTLKPPAIHGDPEGDLLVVGWGSTRGTIEEAVSRIRKDGGKASSIHLTFISPFEPGIKAIMQRFDKVLAVEINYSDDPDDQAFDEDARRYSQLALMLRAKTLIDIDCWSRVPGIPLPPGVIEAVLRERLGMARALNQAPRGG